MHESTYNIPRVFMVSGEASSDLYGAALVSEMRKRVPRLEVYGVGGRKLRESGMDVVADASSLNVVGVSDWRGKWREVWRTYQTVRKSILQRKADVAVLLDLPDFNLRLARLLKAEGIPVVYYISPQVWAWRTYRVHTIRKLVDRMMVVFPFEREFYGRHGVESVFVGHPLLDEIEERTTHRSQQEIERAPRIAILPGSRPSEVRYHASIVGPLVDNIREQYPLSEIQIPVASTLGSEFVLSELSRLSRSLLSSDVTTQDSREVLRWADIALVASGTATLETALIGTPFALFYRLSRTSAWGLKYLFRYKGFFGMPNLLHRKEVVREFLQEGATPAALGAEVRRLLQDTAYREATIEHLHHCRELLGTQGATVRASQVVWDILDRRNSKNREGMDASSLLPAYT